MNLVTTYMTQNGLYNPKNPIDCDPVEFYAVINSIYSDYCEALKKTNASTLEVYACLAKAWLEDGDAVEDKASAYFTYIVES